jgi:hypothetical protein
MDWIEQIFGLNPDGGDGSTEILVVLACTIVLAAVIVARIPRLREGVRSLFQRRVAGS